MAALDTHASAKTQVLELLFPNGTWRELLAAIVWELYEKGDPHAVVFRFRKWFINIPRPGSLA
jgi:hypothetical protein